LSERSKLIHNTKDMLIDLFRGDESINSRMDWKTLTPEIVESAKRLIFNNENLDEVDKLFYLNNLWKINYKGRNRPPTIEEFLTPKYLGSTATDLYPFLRKALIEYFDPISENNYRDAILYMAIGLGKSYFSVIATLFVLTHVILMRDPKRFFGLAQATEITQGYFSFTIKKAEDLLIAPTILMMQNSPMFQRVKTLDLLHRKEREVDNDKFFWTTATKGSSYFTFSSNATIKVASHPSQLLGTQILTGVLSELSFSQDFGKSDDEAYRLLMDLKTRIDSRMKGNYFARTIIDSSPNNRDHKIDDYILNIAPKEKKKQFIMMGSEWKYKTWDYAHVKTSFPVFIGDSGKPPQIISENERGNFEVENIIDVPETPELLSLFQNDIIKALKDRAGIPAGSVDRLIYDQTKIERVFDDNRLNNIYTCIYAPANKEPDNLIWDIIKDEFFVDISGTYEFYRNPKAVRYVGVDQSYSTDVTGIVVLHREINLEGNIVYVIDMSIAIVPTKEKINLEAIKLFIHDLKRKGNLTIGGINFDQFQSQPTIQYLDRKGFVVTKQSVDRTTAPYFNLVNLLNLNRVKAGKNLFLKNNLKSLIMTKRKNTKTKKVDHTMGDVYSDLGDTDWEASRLGFNAKDLSDALAGAISCCDSLEEYTPSDIYYKEKEKINVKEFAIIRGMAFKKELT